MIVALALPLAVQAEEVNDTTVQYNGKRIVIQDDSTETRVAVFSKDSAEYRKTRETSFVSSQEVERVYITSPLFSGNLSESHYSSMYPTVWYGWNQLVTHSKDNPQAGLHAADGGFEIGMTTCESVIPLNRRGNFVYSSGVQCVYERYNFQKSAQLFNQGRHIGFMDVTANPAASNSLSIGTLRIPHMLAWTPFAYYPKDMLDMQLGIGLTPEFHFGADYNFRPETFGDPIHQKMKIYKFSMNLDLNMVLGPVKLGASLGLLPMFKTVDGKKVYRNTTLSVGVNIGELFKKRDAFSEVVIDNY